ncbi:MAG TPA: MFS transporter [Candidatus Paceibacterota bacterium]|nr:MFS transporter [Candidatus Paceibacterota bacterium]
MVKKNSSYKIEKLNDYQKAKTRKYSIVEGSSAAVMTGAGDSYVTPYAVELKANNGEIGLLTSLAGLLGPIAQLFGSKAIERYHRKKLITLAVSLQATTWLVMLVLGFIFLKQGQTSYLIPLLILSYVLFAVFGSFGNPAWFSLMGDIVPEHMRSKYFSNRSKITGTFSITATIFGAILLYYFREQGIIIYGFIVLFAIAAVGRYISAYFFTKHYVSKIKFDKDYYFSFWQFIKKAPFNNFGKFAIFVALIHLSVNIAGPFFSVYMWKDLGFNPIWFMIVNISASIFTIIFLPMWGKFATKYGNREMMRIGSILIVTLPFWWLISSNPIFLIVVPQLVSGIGWAAFNLGASNFIYDAVTVQRRAICVAYYSLLNGIGVFLGASLGGLITQFAQINFMNIFLFVFLISGIARGIVVLIMFKKIHEVKNVAPPKENMFFYLREFKHFIDSKPIHGHMGRKRLQDVKIIK